MRPKVGLFKVVLYPFSCKCARLWPWDHGSDCSRGAAQTPLKVWPHTERTLPVLLRKPRKRGALNTDSLAAFTPGAADRDTARRGAHRPRAGRGARG